MANPGHQLPVFGVNHTPLSLTLDGCVGWANDEHEALILVQKLPETKEAEAAMSLLFGGEYRLGGVKIERMILQDDDGAHYTSTFGRHRYQNVFRAFLDRKRD